MSSKPAPSCCLPLEATEPAQQDFGTGSQQLVICLHCDRGLEQIETVMTQELHSGSLHSHVVALLC